MAIQTHAQQAHPKQRGKNGRGRRLITPAANPNEPKLKWPAKFSTGRSSNKRGALQAGPSRGGTGKQRLTPIESASLGSVNKALKGRPKSSRAALIMHAGLPAVS